MSFFFFLPPSLTLNLHCDYKMHTQYDPTSNYTANIVDFSSHQNIEISKQVVPRTTRDYIRTLVLFNQ